MPRFLARHRFLVGSILGLAFATIGFVTWCAVAFRTPLDVRIALHPAGRIEQTIRVGMDARHQLQLVFTSRTRPNDETRRLVEGSRSSEPNACDPHPCDVVVPLRWSLTDASGRIVQSGMADTHGAIGGSGETFYRGVGEPFYLKSGSYGFRAEITRDVAQFDGVMARLTLSQGGGKPSNWQAGLRFFGELTVAVVVLPLIALLSLILLGLWIWEKWHTRATLD